MGEVIHLFTRQQVDALTDDDVFGFVEDHLADFLVEAQMIGDANTIEKMQHSMRRVKALVDTWPDDL
jgi:hypothetical protein